MITASRSLVRGLAVVLVVAVAVTVAPIRAEAVEPPERAGAGDDDPSSTGALPGVLVEPQAYPGSVLTGGTSLDRAQVAALFAMALALPPAARDPFTDDEGLTHESSINRLASAGLTAGCGASRYCPDRSVTRAEFAVLLERAVPQPPTALDFFHDDEGRFAEGAIDRLAAAGIIHGCGTDRACPNGAVTRGEASTMLSRALGSRFSSTDPVERWRPIVAVWFSDAEVDRALRVIHCESRGDPTAVNPTSGASGLFQHMPRYWNDRAAWAGVSGRSIFDPDANVAAAAWLVHHDGGWRHWYASAECWS